MILYDGVVSGTTLIITTHSTQMETDDCHLYGWTRSFTVSGTTMTLTNVSGLVCYGDGHGGHDSLDPITGGMAIPTQ